ncbi:hypothetical protein FHR22_003216 [Sphingopyxis panaciterrae]|uniref:TonB-dependent receptor domain-containing protein n=1 Tax=Sphingopyxis panaciterrae TaxID=363841 RepID=UPI001421E71A|nr:hypothetical protein [Sphingopyxis panaciterrae]
MGGFNGNAAGALTGTNSAAQLALAGRRGQVGPRRTHRRTPPTDGSREILGDLADDRDRPDLQGHRRPYALCNVQAWREAGHFADRGGDGTRRQVGTAETEKTDAYELGFRSLLFDNTLSLSATGFWQDIENYIQPSFVFDEVQTALNNNGLPVYLSALGNVPKVRSKGVELDVAYFGIPYTTLRFAGAYTDARYRSFPRAANPGELGAAIRRAPIMTPAARRWRARQNGAGTCSATSPTRSKAGTSSTPISIIISRAAIIPTRRCRGTPGPISGA